MDNARRLPSRRIFELKKKAEVMALVEHKRDPRKSSKMPRWANRHRIYERLRSCWRQERGDTVNEDLEDALAAIAGFNKNDPSWFDPLASEKESGKIHRNDTAEQFERMLFAAHGLGDAWRLVANAADLAFRDLVSFTIIGTGDGQSISGTNPFPLFLTVDVWPGFLAGVHFAFKSLQITLRLGRGTPASFTEILGRQQPAAIRGGGYLSANQDAHNPVWTLTDATKVVLNGSYYTDDVPLCELKRAGLEEVVVAEVRAHRMDARIATPSGKELSTKNREKVLGVIAMKAIDDGATSNKGWMYLGSQEAIVLHAARVQS